MKNPFESIRKLTSSKLKHFETCFLVTLYVFSIIPFLALGYQMGRTTLDSSQWLLDLSSLLGAFGSLLGGLATVFAAWVAFGAYGTWKKQITHPEIFQNDFNILKELNEIHGQIFNSLEFVGDDIVNDYKLYLLESALIKNSNSLIDESGRKEKYLKKSNLYYCDLKNLGFNKELLVRIHKLLYISKLPFEDETELSKIILRYFLLARYLFEQYDNICVYVDFCKTDEKIFDNKLKVDDVKYDGLIHQEMNKALNIVNCKITQKWDL
ncbi:hypothetical protein [Photobacterium leiognathi]|uniref:hypothetical protein n=1 Tax=Photobacterium leiognathi TaxID=553611 RepID=UPI0029825F28|nr:hypothetical protein [Photobacterium leiognathi]